MASFYRKRDWDPSSFWGSSKVIRCVNSQAGMGSHVGLVPSQGHAADLSPLTRAGLKTSHFRWDNQAVLPNSTDSCQQMQGMEKTEPWTTGRPVACKAWWDLTSPTSSQQGASALMWFLLFQHSKASLLVVSDHLSICRTSGNSPSFPCLNFLTNNMGIMIVLSLMSHRKG